MVSLPTACSRAFAGLDRAVADVRLCGHQILEVGRAALADGAAVDQELPAGRFPDQGQLGRRRRANRRRQRTRRP
jgi:hypothetical protein